jgi:hypothetical protein
MTTQLATNNANNIIVPLSLEAAREKAPGIFADKPAPRVSKDYKFTSSLQLVEHLDSAGWKLVEAKQSTSKNANPIYTTYGTHIMKFSHPELYMKDNRGGIEGRPQIVILNNHNGDRPLQIEAGCFRLVCSNGLMIKTQDFGTIKERHIKYTQEQVSKLVDDQVIKIESAVKRINQWIMKPMTSKEQFAFAAEALALRLSGDRKPEQYELLSILTPKRKEDEQNDLWHIFNRTQENLIKGGFELNERQARAINNPLLDMEMNLKLWEIAEKYAS